MPAAFLLHAFPIVLIVSKETFSAKSVASIEFKGVAMSESPAGTATIAIIGTGEMGAAVGQRLRDNGARALTTLKGRSTASVERIARAGLEIIDDDDALVREADLILSIVPPGQAHAVATRFRPALTRSQNKPAFVECNAISPATMRRIAESLAATGCPVIDAGIIGGPPSPARPQSGPRFYASGADANLMIRLRQYGLNVKILEGPIGAASAFKMSYGGITKGLIAIGAAMIAAAARENLSAPLADELSQSQPGLFAFIRGGIPNMVPKAYRWVAEMEQIAEFLDDADAGSKIYSGIARLYEQVAADRERDGDEAQSFAPLRSFFDVRDRTKA
jgi:3-hydroxyisobutyrate dehydrogenase-like beta-hydroxyacid dehydrogenase